MVKRKTIIVLCLTMLLILLFVGCESGNLVESYEIQGVPNRIVYISNLDTELDLSGLITVITFKDGSSMTTGSSEDMSWGVVTETTESTSNQWKVIHDIDFTKPGVYQVEIYYEWISVGSTTFQRKNKVVSYKYFIQVLDDAVFSALKEGTGE